MVVMHSETLWQLCVATRLLNSCLKVLTEEQRVARKHVNAVYPALDIRYGGVLPIHIARVCPFPFTAGCFVQISAPIIDISP